MTKKLILITVGLVIILALFFNCERNRANRLNFEYLKEVAKNATLIKESADTYSKLTAAVATEEALKSQLVISNKELSKLVKSRNEKVMEYNSLKLKFENLQTAFNTVSEIDSAGRCIVPIDTVLGKVNLVGRTKCDSSGGRVEFDTLQISPIRLQLFKTKAKTGLWNYYVTLSQEDSSFLAVDSLEIMFTETKPSFLQKHAWKIGIVAGVATILLLK